MNRLYRLGKHGEAGVGECACFFWSPPDNEVAITDLPFPASPKPIVLKGGEAVIDADVFVSLIEALSATVKT